jgi:hypothetical protein
VVGVTQSAPAAETDDAPLELPPEGGED